MTIKQTDRDQIRAFGEKGIELFDTIENELEHLVTEAANVAYRGANAFQFKTDCVNNAVSFAEQCTKTMTEISKVITENTTYIAEALGGEPITLEPPTIRIAAPSIDADTSVESADSTPLHELSASARVRYATIADSFSTNLDNLETLGADGWIGPEYDEASGEVGRLTGEILGMAEESRQAMITYVNDQLQALGMA